MPLSQINNCHSARNKQNASNQIDPENKQQKSPQKKILISLQSQRGQSPLKKCHNNSIESNLITKLRIQIADKQFQLKKLQEDSSVKITTIMRELNKQKQEKKQLIKQHRQKIEEEQQYWKRKLQQAKEQHQKQLDKKKEERDISIAQQLENKLKVIQQNYCQQIDSLNKALSSLKQTHVQQIETLKLSYQESIQNMTKSHKIQLQANYSQFKEQIQSRKLSYLKEVQQLREKQKQIQKQNQIVQTTYYEKIKKYQQNIEQKNAQIQLINEKCKRLSQELETLKQEKQNYRLDSIVMERKCNKLQKEFQEKYVLQTQQMKNQYDRKYQQEKKKFQDFKKDLEQIHTQCLRKYEQQLKLSQQRSQNLLSVFTTCQSKPQDIKKIQVLEMKLIKKQIQLQKQRQDLRICKLQLNNMDQLYQKMFQEAKVKSLKTRKLKLPSLMEKNSQILNRSTMDCYEMAGKPQKNKQRKFSIREVNHNKQFKSGQISAVYE